MHKPLPKRQGRQKKVWTSYDQSIEGYKTTALGNFFLIKQQSCINFEHYSDAQLDGSKRIFFSNVAFLDEDYDILVLRVEDGNEHNLPQPITAFGDLPDGGSVELVGHPDRNVKLVDHECRLKDPAEFIKTANDKLKEELKKNNIPYGKVSNFYQIADKIYLDDKRYFFDCRFQFGGSGSPGFHIDADGKVKVVTMLAGGLPPVLLSKSDCTVSIPEGTRLKLMEDHPGELFVEYGFQMKALCSLLFERNSDLAYTIFQDNVEPQWIDAIPNLRATLELAKNIPREVPMDT